MLAELNFGFKKGVVLSARRKNTVKASISRVHSPYHTNKVFIMLLQFSVFDNVHFPPSYHDILLLPYRVTSSQSGLAN